MSNWQTNPVQEADIQFNTRAAENFNLCGFIDDQLNGQSTNAPQEAALVRSRHEQFRNMGLSHRGAGGFNLPIESIIKRAAVLKGSNLNGTGGELVPTAQGDLIPELYPNSIIDNAGVRVVQLVNDTQYPKFTTTQTAYLVGEDTAITESAADFSSVTLRWENSIGCLSVVSRSLLAQSDPSVSDTLRRDMESQIMTKADEQVMASVGDAVTETLAQTLSFGLMADLVAEVEANNALGQNPVFVTTPQVAKLLRTTARQSGGAEGNFVADAPVGRGLTVMGFPVVVSSSVPSNLGTGTDEHGLYFGSFQESVVAGFFGGMYTIIDEHSLAEKNHIRIVMSVGFDSAVTRSEGIAGAGIAI